MLISLNFDPGVTLDALAASETQWTSNENTYRARLAPQCGLTGSLLSTNYYYYIIARSIQSYNGTQFHIITQMCFGAWLIHLCNYLLSNVGKVRGRRLFDRQALVCWYCGWLCRWIVVDFARLNKPSCGRDVDMPSWHALVICPRTAG